MDSRLITDGGTTVNPGDGDAPRRHLEQFAGQERVTETPDGTLAAEFSGSTSFEIDADGHVESGMPLHSFDGPVDELRFDHEAGEIHVSAAAVSYTFRRPSR